MLFVLLFSNRTPASAFTFFVLGKVLWEGCLVQSFDHAPKNTLADTCNLIFKYFCIITDPYQNQLLGKLWFSKQKNKKTTIKIFV